MRPPGTIGILSGDLARYSAFNVALMAQFAAVPSHIVWRRGVDVVGNLNQMVREMRGDWLWILGDDHEWYPDTLPRLIEHDVDVVVPLCLKRTPPYSPVVYTHQNDEGAYCTPSEFPDEGLLEIHAAGGAGMLIRRHVLEAIGDPWFETGTNGLNEDLTFCAKVREAGFRIWCDPMIPFGHISNVTVWPFRSEQTGEWHVGMNLGNDVFVPLPMAAMDPKLIEAAA